MESKPFGFETIQVEKKPLSLLCALIEQLNKFRSNTATVMKESQDDDLTVIKKFAEEFKINVELKHSNGLYQGTKICGSKDKLKVLKVGNEYFSILRTEGTGKARKRKFENKLKKQYSEDELKKRKEKASNVKHKEEETNNTLLEKPFSGTGLKNISNFCYGNSVLQSLVPFRKIIKEKQDGNGSSPFITSMEEVS